MTDLVLVPLYPDLLRTYGDRGNALVLQRRAEWRGFSVRVQEVRRGDPLPPDGSLLLLGGGSDRVQASVAGDLAGRRDQLAEAIDRGAVVLGVCGGYQLLGRRYIAADGAWLEGLGLLDVTTSAAPGRLTGRVRARARLDGRTFDLVGFENHGGRTRLGPAAEPLATVRRRQGNNGQDGTEGAVQGSIVGTYLHGPVLAANPAFADALLARALAKVTGGAPLRALDDSLERAAHQRAATLAGRPRERLSRRRSRGVRGLRARPASP